MVIWKLPLNLTTLQSILASDGSAFLSVAEQYDSIVLYAMVDPSELKKWYEVAIIGTGHEMPEWANRENFVGTAKIADGHVMFHVFIRPE